MNFMSLTRRGLLFGAAGLAALLTGLPERADAQTPPGVLIVGQIAEPKSMDPAAVTAVNDFRILVNMYEGLTLSLIHISGPRDQRGSRMPSSA